MAKILVIDDEDIVLAVIRQSLERAGHDVTASKTVDEGLAHSANTEHLDLVILNNQLKASRDAKLLMKSPPNPRKSNCSGFPVIH